MKRIAGAGLVALALLASACHAKGNGGYTGATVPVEKVTTTTTIDVTKIPDTITVEYANAVMKSLDHVLGDAFRDLVASKAPTAQFDDRLVALYIGKELEHQRSVYGQMSAEGFINVRPSPGDPVTTVDAILSPTSSCTLFAVNRDFAAFFADPKPVSTKGFVALVPKDAVSDPQSLNPTPWALAFDGDTRSHAAPSQPCG